MLLLLLLELSPALPDVLPSDIAAAAAESASSCCS
jgi:hypothetical protein